MLLIAKVDLVITIYIKYLIIRWAFHLKNLIMWEGYSLPKKISYVATAYAFKHTFMLAFIDVASVHVTPLELI